jgi:hypothetical protein
MNDSKGFINKQLWSIKVTILVLAWRDRGKLLSPSFRIASVAAED